MRINIKKSFFGEREFVICENNGMKAKLFKYSTGVEAIRVENTKGYFIILPFQGQQIWRANFLGRELTMKTKFDEPVPTIEYLKTYGGFLLHCGINAFGVPSKDDDHPQHGEIPNGEYKTAYIEINDEYIAVGGSLFFDKSFVKSYTFSPECRLYRDDTVLKINVELENRRDDPMEYMYLCHINFRPINGAELIYSADYNNVKVFKSIGDTVPKDRAEKLLGFMNELEKNPELHHKVGAENEIYNPEICFAEYGYMGDESNRAYTLQYTDDGACFVSHPTDILPVVIRWISRTNDEDSMGMALPATAEHLGYTNAKRLGQIKILPPLSKLNFLVEAGWLPKTDADNVKKKIEEICRKA